MKLLGFFVLICLFLLLQHDLRVPLLVDGSRKPVISNDFPSPSHSAFPYSSGRLARTGYHSLVDGMNIYFILTFLVRCFHII